MKNQKKKKEKETNKKIHDRRPPCHFIMYGKHAVYFEFLKRFIDIPFVKTIQRISF